MDFRTLIYAAREGDLETVRACVEANIQQEADEQGYTALYWAACGEDMEMVNLLLEQSTVYLNHLTGSMRWTPLTGAVTIGNVEVAKLLLDHGAEHLPDRNGASPLYLAAENGDYRMCKLLLQYGATYTPKRNGKTPLHAVSESSSSYY